MMIKSIRELLFDNVGVVPFLFSTIIAAKVIGYSLWPVDIVSYISLVIGAIFLLSKGLKFDKLLLIFVIYLPISIFIDQPSPFFSPWLRYLLLFLLMICVSPLLSSHYAYRFRYGVFKMTLIYCVIVSVISFFCYFIGINLMQSSVSNIEMGYLINKAGTFGGITPHSMLLGPISGIATLACSYLVINGKNKKLWICISIICCGVLLFSASRSSLVAMVAGEMYLLWFHTWQRGKSIKYFVLILFVGAVTFPLWQDALDGVSAKNKGKISTGLDTSSRNSKWDIRIEEFQDSPVTGIGFASVSSRDYYGSDGSIEPGSSWLAILSMTGIIGFTLFIIIFWRAIKNSLLTITPEGALLGGVLVLLGVHMLAEGHIFSAGSFLCFCVWLTIGCCTDYASKLKLRE